MITRMERREFLKLGLTITGVSVGGGFLSVVSNFKKVFASTEEYRKKYPYKPHYTMLIRQNRCIDCGECMKACVKTNNVPGYGYRTTILERYEKNAIGSKREFIPMLCMQCNNPPCVRACPVEATYKDKKTGIVRMHYEKCIGCKTCMEACPYDARYFNDERHAIDKCDFCFDTRLSKGMKLPACAEACPTKARVFGDLSNPNDEVFRIVHQMQKAVWVLRPEVGTKPNVFYTTSDREVSDEK
ncbi:MAG: 4Fe-4S dicluster domain-containing protein [Epsilonproteobacteria bacterium]|nr:4Fe-4S dicluster domain-containing protein [Campylobacterota bacterium]